MNYATSKTLLTFNKYSVSFFFFSLGPSLPGAQAKFAYQSALKDGAVNVYRGRVLLIGQDRAGKTSLKKSLIGLPFNSKEKSTDGIEVDPSKFQLDVGEVRNWQPIDERKQGLLGCSKDVAQVVAERMYTGELTYGIKNRKQVDSDGEKKEVSLVNQVCPCWF